MAYAEAHLPQPLSSQSITTLLTSLDLPRPSSVRQLLVATSFHTVYQLDFEEKDLSRLAPAKSPSLALRVSGSHVAKIKTENEVACMTWIVRNCPSIPVPAVVRWDSSIENTIGAEYTLLEFVSGVSVESKYEHLSESEKLGLVKQLTIMLEELHDSKVSPGVHGLMLQSDKLKPGPFIDERIWFTPDIEKFWGPTDTIMTVNSIGMFDSYAHLAETTLEKQIQAIQKHSSLDFMVDLVPRLDNLQSLVMKSLKDELNDTKYVFTHRDLHFGNIMFDPNTCRITSILDWEFSAVIPAFMWNQGNPFLWNMRRDAKSKEDQTKLLELFHKEVQEKRYTCLDQTSPNEAQKSLNTVLDHVRAILEVTIRSETGSKALAWKKIVEETLSKLEAHKVT
jgi:hypothetical protein